MGRLVLVPVLLLVVVSAVTRTPLTAMVALAVLISMVFGLLQGEVTRQVPPNVLPGRFAIVLKEEHNWLHPEVSGALLPV